MTGSTRAPHPARAAIAALVIDVLFVLALWAQRKWLGAGVGTGLLTLVGLGLKGFAVTLFLLLAWRDVLFLFTRPTKTLGRGLTRVWAVAITTLLEAWAGRIWLLPLIWFACALLLIMAVVPFDESERIPLYIRTLITTQQILVLVMLWVMACVSLPREREKRTLVSTASKPLSRLEILIGKFAGFALATAVMLLLMYVASLAILYVSDSRLRGRAAEAYDIQHRDFETTRQAPSEALKQISEEGSLFAGNSVTVPPGGMSILGAFHVDPETKKPVREILGGTYQKISYRFTPFLPAYPNLLVAGPGQRPYFNFNFPVDPRSAPVKQIELRVSAYCSASHRIPPPTPQEKTVILNAAGQGHWEPDDPNELFTPVGPDGRPIGLDGTPADSDMGEVTVEVTCNTPNVYLLVLEGGTPDPANGYSSDVDWNVTYAVDRQSAGPQSQVVQWVPAPNPVVRGFERRERQEVSGPKENSHMLEYAVYRFPGASLVGIPLDGAGNFKLSLQLETYKSSDPLAPTYANIDVFSSDPAAGDLYQFPQKEVLEKRSMQLDVPKRLLGDLDPAKRGDMFVRIYSVTPDHSISLTDDSVRIELGRTPFFVNLFKSELIIYLETLLLIGVAITCSVRLGWPVAMFLTAACMAYGVLVNYIASLSVEYGGLAALNYRPEQHSDALFKFLDQATNVLWQVLAFISSIVPNFTIFDPQAFIGTLQNTPWHIIWGDAVHVLTYSIPFLALSYLMFRKQELG